MRIIVIPLKGGTKLKTQDVMSGFVGGVIPHSCCLLAMFFAGLGMAGVSSMLGRLMDFRGSLMLAGLFASIALNRKHLFSAGKFQVFPLLFMVCVFYLTYWLIGIILR